ncbi:Mitochondrial tRNAs modification protein [Pleosporales sp. CAS-2024a]
MHMLCRPHTRRPASSPGLLWPRPRRRPLVTLAIETSCDDTAVAVLDKHHDGRRPLAQLLFHKKRTANNAAYHGVHPLVALRWHQEHLAALVHEAVGHLPRRRPDVVAVTRGPGMRSSLATGLDTAKGLAVAWQKPLVGVHHMQAHALTPRLLSALAAAAAPALEPAAPALEPAAPALEPAAPALEPAFPFLSVLASGGHTLLIHSSSLTHHQLLGATADIALGEYLDKVARILLPADLLHTTTSTMYGALLEQLAFPATENETTNARLAFSSAGCSAERCVENSRHRYPCYQVPANHEEACIKASTKWGWAFHQPLTTTSGGLKVKQIALSFSGLLTAAERVIRYETDPLTRKRTQMERSLDDISPEEKRDIAKETMRAAFEHVAYRVVLALESLSTEHRSPSVVLAGGVAANSFLRHVLASTLCARGYAHTTLYFPPPSFCTDNAAMIAWAGLEMFEAGHTDPLGIRAIRKWPLDQLLHPIVDG